MNPEHTNWAGNITFGAARHHAPASIEELQVLAAGSPRMRAIGTAHSFNRLADTTGDLISVAGLPKVLEIDAARRTVTVAAGMRNGELGSPLHRQGWALPNLASLPHISVAGAVSTGTHGSGDALGSLSTAVRAVQLVTTQGEVATLDRDRDGDTFPGAVIALGALGILTQLTLDLVPAFEVRQHVYDELPYAQLVKHFDEILSAAYSVSVFITWRAPLRAQVWLKRRSGDHADEPAPRWLGARLADGPRHPMEGMSPAACTPQLGEPGPWHERLPHFRLDFMPSSGEELQSEFFVGRDTAVEALSAVARMADMVAPILQTAEIRSVTADDLWLSPSYRRDSVALHFTWIADQRAVASVVTALEKALAPFGARPHWGKVTRMKPSIVSGRYERADDFRALTRLFDPDGALRNDLLEAYFPTDA